MSLKIGGGLQFGIMRVGIVQIEHSGGRVGCAAVQTDDNEAAPFSE
jgi:hypothetical protein